MRVFGGGHAPVCGFALALAVASSALGQPATDVYVPDELRQWREWVLHEHPEVACPIAATDGERTGCAWIRELGLDVGKDGAAFRLEARLFAESDVPLPAVRQSWPRDVRVDGRPAMVLGGPLPRLRLAAGRHYVTGTLPWNNEPEFVDVPSGVGLITLSRNGEPVRTNLDGDRLWLGERADTDESRETLEVRVYRRLVDDVPQTLTTVISLSVGGDGRIVDLGVALPPDFVVTALEQELPARIEEDGRLSVQVQRGEWSIAIEARAVRHLDDFAMAEPSGHWPATEIWGFEARRHLRIVRVEGVAGVDLAQVDAPWADVPGYSLGAGETLRLVEQQRGDVNPSPGRFDISRKLWLDFDGSGYVVEDNIMARLDRDVRIVADYVPGRIDVNGLPRLVTRLGDGEPGVELTAGSASIKAVSAAGDRLSASGWRVDAASLGAQLHLPPGWRLLWASGPDSAPEAWLDKWRLWDAFIVVLLLILVWRVTNPAWAAVVALAVLLSYQVNPIPTYGWLALAGVVALLRAVRHEMTYKVFRATYWVALVPVAVVCIYFSVGQARQAIYPQLEAVSDAVRFARSVRPEVMRTVAEPDAVAVDMLTEAPLPRAEEETVEEIVVTAAYRDRDNIRIQTGPGSPQWSWNVARLLWDGPVEADQPLDLALLPPPVTRLLSAAAAVLSLFVVGFFILLSRPRLPRLPPWLSRMAPVLALFILAPDAAAQLPDAELLQTLEERLLEKPGCLPDCASVSTVAVDVDDDSLRVMLDVHVGGTFAVPLPLSDRVAQPSSVTVGTSRVPLSRDGEGRLSALLGPGVHSVRMEVSVADLRRLDIHFPIRPGSIAADARGWRVYGIADGTLAGDNIQLERLESDAGPSSSFESGALVAASVQPYVEVRRDLRFDFESHIETTVTRLAPLEGGFEVEVPLLAGETLLSDDVRVAGRVVTAAFGPSVEQVWWLSRYEVADTVELTAPSVDRWREVWTAHGSDFWHVRHEGIIPVDSSRSGTTFRPRSGESVRLHLESPLAVPGDTVTVESVRTTVRPGSRTYLASLGLTLRATQGGEFPVRLPSGAQVQSVEIEGESQPIPEAGEISLPIEPGVVRYHVGWRGGEDLGVYFETPEVVLARPANNIDIAVEFPRDRWTILLGGPTLGAALLFWGVVAVVAALALALSRLPNFPLTTTDALLLSVGMTLCNLSGVLLLAAWFVAIWWRSRQTLESMNETTYQLVQILLTLAGLVALGALVWSIPAALLGQPEMQVAGYGSNESTYRWYADHSGETLPTAWVVSLPTWVYRLAMWAWSLWLAFALVRWVRGAWRTLAEPGYLTRPEVQPSEGG
ncbi:MAG: hypothetical protein OXP28_17720 [Gammaproteobacteria bacterium]|nr:hypothetical protein [Gammaproteobacteria bacterium]